MSANLPLLSTGTTKKHIPVRISYRIIELFSAGLYQSPNKAVEELVANSYDAEAQHVAVILPDDLNADDAVIWVVDDGSSMDEAGLEELWEIATSHKRDPGRESKKRPPIGKFGIGKLASYVLARTLTHVTNVNGVYRAVTMDFREVEKGKTTDEKTLELAIRELTEAEAKKVLEPMLVRLGKAGAQFKLFGASALPTWTVAAMSDFKPLALTMKRGVLRRVLATALPMSPQFTLYLDGERLTSPKEAIAPIQSWTVGVDDAVAAKKELPVLTDPAGVQIAELGPIQGTVELYADPLTGGKADKWGHSNGIFVVVRGRVINLHDPLFGLPALSHGPFSRFRMVVTADGLDRVLRATRESVIDSPAVDALRSYIQAKFNEARLAYEEWLKKQQHAAQLPNRVGATPQSLSRRPLLNAIRRVVSGEIPALTLTNVPRLVKAEDREKLLDELEADLESEAGLIREIKLAALGVEQGLAVFDAADRTVYVNALHPFYANYSEHFHNSEPFELIAVTEVLTEGYLIEEGIDPEVVQRILERRDRFLRELVYTQRLSAPLVAELLRDSVSSEEELENAVARALEALGFEVSEISGKGNPDGIAYARVGVRDASEKRGDFLIAYDAKSTGKDRVKAKDLNISGVARHRAAYSATYSLIVAPGFEGDGDDNSAAHVDAKTHSITLMTVKDLISLVLVATTHRLAFPEIRNLFDTCRTPVESRAWIEKAKRQEPAEWPVPEILQAVWELQGDEQTREPVKLAAVRMVNDQMKRFTSADLQAWLQGIKRFAPTFVSLNGDVVFLEVSPERIIKAVRGTMPKVPVEYQSKAFVAGLEAAEQGTTDKTDSPKDRKAAADKRKDK